jgi:hypothetical protein
MILPAGDLMPHPATRRKKPIPKFLINSDAASRAAGDTMRNHDFVSDGFLALIVAGLLLLCSILVVIALH